MLSSKLSILFIIDLLTLINPINHALNLIDIFGIKIQGPVEILKRFRYLSHLLVYLAYIYINGRFLRQVLLQVQEDFKSILVLAQSQQNLRLLE